MDHLRVLVTGGAGFLGSHLAEALLGAGHQVRVLDDFSSGRWENLAAAEKELETVLTGDVRDPEACRRAVEGVEAVFHLAAIPSVPLSFADPVRTTEVNLMGTVRLAAAARAAGVARLIFASSAAVYGDGAPVPASEQLPPAPGSPYALQKAACERHLRLLAGSGGPHALSLRFFNLFGPRQDPASPYSGVISRFAAALRAGRPPTVFGDGEQTRDFLFVSDAVSACLLALSCPRAGGEAVNVGSGERISVNRLLKVLEEATGAGCGRRTEPPREGDILHSQADISLASSLLGYHPRIPFTEGIRRLLEG